MMTEEHNHYCHYSDLPSPMAYMETDVEIPKKEPSTIDIDRVIEMAWEDTTPFDAIKIQFGLSENDVKEVMKKHLKFNSYKLWRERASSCKTKHAKIRNPSINRFKCKLQRTITFNRISKRKTK